MPHTNVKTAWVNGNLVFYDKSGNEIMTVDGTNRELTIPSGANLGVAALNLDTTELGYLDGVTAGTVLASKAVVVDASKNAGDFAALDAVDIDAGASGTAGSVDVFPATASKGKLTLTCANQTGNTTVTLNANAMGQATQVNVADPGAAASYVAQSTAALTLAEVDRLDGATAGTPVASKVVIADANQNIGAIKGTSLAIGTSGAEVALSATPAQLNSVGSNIGAVAGTGVAVAETGFGSHKTTVFTFTDTPVVLADAAGVVAYGGLKIYDFPQGYIYFVSAVSDIALTKSSAGVNDTWDGDVGFGTATASNNNTLTGTEQNVIPSTATPQAVAGATTADAVSTATEHAIVDGTAAALDLYVNLLVDDADHDVTTTPCNLILNGTLRLNWIYMGDN